MKTISKPILKNYLTSIVETGNVDNEKTFQILRQGMIEQFNICQKDVKSQKAEDEFYEFYRMIIDTAVKGFLPSQDYLGYMYKTGLGDMIPANYTNSMDWQFMSGSNGNDYTIKRLKIFFTRCYDDILNMPDAVEILNKNDIYSDNYEREVGKLLCDAMVDALGLNIVEIASRKPLFQASSIQLAQKYEKARQSATLSVIEYLKKTAE